MPMDHPTPNRMMAMTVVRSAMDRKMREIIQDRESMGAIVGSWVYYFIILI